MLRTHCDHWPMTLFLSVLLLVILVCLLAFFSLIEDEDDEPSCRGCGVRSMPLFDGECPYCRH